MELQTAKIIASYSDSILEMLVYHFVISFHLQ